jgi:hypothetical protein
MKDDVSPQAASSRTSSASSCPGRQRQGQASGAYLATQVRRRIEPTGSIGEYIFLDTDGSGVPKLHSGIVGVTVELMQDDVVIATKVTGADGSCKFDKVLAGEYTVAVSNVPNDLVYACGLDNPQEGKKKVHLGAGENTDDVDVGYNVFNAFTAVELLSFAGQGAGIVTSELLGLQTGINELVANRRGEGVWYNAHAL